MRPRIVKVEDLHKDDFRVETQILKVKDASFIIYSNDTDNHENLAIFNPSDPLEGWTAPLNPKIKSTATVVFYNGIGYYSFDGTDWNLIRYDEEYNVPLVINQPFLVAADTQMLYAQTITVNDLLTIDGMLIQTEISNNTPTCCTWAQIHWDFNDTLGTVNGQLVLFTSPITEDDVITWEKYDTLLQEWTSVQTGGSQYDWAGEEGAGIYRVKIEVDGCCDYYTNIIEVISV